MLAFNTILPPLHRRTQVLLALACLAIPCLIASVGCDKPATSTSLTLPAANTPTPPPKRVYAQGQIMPALGIIKLYITPGDVVSEIPAQVGMNVKRGDILAIMRSETTFQSQQTTLQEQKNSAIRERDSAVKQARLKLSAAQMKVQQVQSQQQSLDRQSSLFDDADNQIASSERILQQLRIIAADSLTREFVGQLEIDRQRLGIEEARSKVAQQRNTREQAAVDLRLAAQAALAEVDAAQTMLDMAQQVDPGRAFDAQIAALQSETGRSVLTAPIDGVILAVHTSIGGSVVQTPLIELANLDSVVCELEVNVTQARWIEPNQKVTIKCDSLPEALSGRVQEKSQIVGKPRLRSLDPLAAVDYRTMSVIVALDKPEIAGQWLQLQVEGQIDLSNDSRP